MSLGHLSILLTHYEAFYRHVYWGHAAGTKSQLTQTSKHSSRNMSQALVVVANSCFLHMWGLWQAPVSEAHSRDNIKLCTYIRNCSHCMSQGHEAAVKSCFIVLHSSGNVAGTFIRSSQQGYNLFMTHIRNCNYVSQGLQPQGVALSDFSLQN